VLQSFSAAGQLTERRDATGARVLWTYDRVGRLLTERALDPAGALTSEVRYTYDRSQDPAACTAAASSPPSRTPPAASRSTTTPAAASSA
jgi:YD repeat-containing protein